VKGKHFKDAVLFSVHCWQIWH